MSIQVTVYCSNSKWERVMAADSNYDINIDVKYEPLEVVDIQSLIDGCTSSWFNQTLVRVNDSVVRVGIVQGEFHWHKHDREDELFYVVEGCLFIDLEGRTIELHPKHCFTVPKGVLHRTRAPQRTVILMIGSAGIVPTGN
jgi:mannose-6-phosphate isomerase-like protein (cupin superfamily)